jgi:DMSO/TMAO reductase YedYZ molybdopterin-dependent catalytic subunit
MDVRPSHMRAAAAGLVAAGAALASGELLAGLLGDAPSPVLAVSRLVTDLQPPGAKDLVVSLFGTNDKLALQVLIVAVVLAAGAALGVLGARRFGVAQAGVIGLAAVGFLGAVRDPSVSVGQSVLISGAVAIVGLVSLGWLLDAAGGPVGSSGGGLAAGARQTPAAQTSAVREDAARRRMAATGWLPDWSRRTLLIRGGGVALASLVAGTVGRILIDAARIAPLPIGTLPGTGRTVSLPSGAELDVLGITPLVVPTEDFYRIDTSFSAPTVDVGTWTLRVHGMVDREVVLTWDELTALETFQQYVTIACVSNRVGGSLIGNAKWTGVRLREVLAMAGVHADATQLVGRSVDGFTAGMPTAWVMDRTREPMIAIGMNDQPLPRAHGYPARLIVPGLYGYVSATKWLAELELTTLDAFDAYWVPLGWAKEAPILTQSRIDVPAGFSRIAAGRVPIAGVAWAPDRGISRVEVAVDGDWRDATVSTPISNATWVQWLVDWEATPGDHTIEVRATDGTGVVQTAERTEPAPDGARGHHIVQVSVA